MSDRIINRILALAVFLAGLFIYLRTIAPTTSFWDCGEFIACSYQLGVPHPPGAPFYLLLGRIFSMLPLAADIGLRVNIISAICTALSVMLTYLIIVRLIKLWRGQPQILEDRIILYPAAVIAAMAFAGTDSLWFNAVEAEVYAISMFFTAIVIWLILVWLEKSNEIGNERYILMIAYCVGLALGVHLLNILALPAIFLIVYFNRTKKVTIKSLALLGLAFCATFLFIYQGIVKGIPWIADKISIITFPLIILLLPITIYFARKKARSMLSLILTSCFLIIIGFSTYTMIYLRSNLDPPIDENDPENTSQILAYLNRDQYGEWGIMPRRYPGIPQEFDFNKTHSGSYAFHSLDRQLDFLWNYQIKKMYLRYFGWQFIGKGTTLGADNYIKENISLQGLWGLPFLLGLVGMFHHFTRDKRHAFAILVLVLMTGIAIVLYLNQEDPQPRERDYVFVGSFFAFSLWLGIGVSALLEYTQKLFTNRTIRHFAFVGVTGILFLTVPVNLLVFNYESHDRTGNYVAYDYSYNLLQTCEKDAIVFTNGDNDTFPLWFLQYVYGIRTDVRVVNLSLLNTSWYIKQLKTQEPKVPISLNLEEIDALQYPLQWQEKTISIPVPQEVYHQQLEELGPGRMLLNQGAEGAKEITINLKPTLYNRFLRIQDFMVLNIIYTNRWQRPIYFAVTVPAENFVNLDNYLRMDGLDQKLVTYRGDHISPERMEKNLFEIFKFRGLDDPEVYYDTSTQGLLQNYRAAFLSLAISYANQQNYAKVLQVLNKMATVVPENVIPINNTLIEMNIGRLYHLAGQSEEFEKRLYAIKEREPNNGQVYSFLLMLLSERKDYNQAATVLQDWVANHPDDRNAINKIAEFRRLAQKNDSIPGKF